MGPALEVRRLEVAGPALAAFREISFEVSEGEAVGITATGAQPLTPLLEVLAGLRPPDAGEVLWGGTSSLALAAAKTARARYRLERAIRLAAGFVSPAAPLLQNRTIEENIALPVRYHLAASEEEASSRLERLMDRLGLAEHTGRRPAGLPEGVLRRAAMARALVLEPKVLILESPFSGIERESAKIMADVILERRKAGMAFLASAADPPELAGVCTRVLVLDGGRLKTEEDHPCAPRSAG